MGVWCGHRLLITCLGYFFQTISHTVIQLLISISIMGQGTKKEADKKQQNLNQNSTLTSPIKFEHNNLRKRYRSDTSGGWCFPPCAAMHNVITVW